MNINTTLLPPQYFKKLRREKALRLGIMFLMVIDFVLLVGLVFMLPSYFMLVFSQSYVAQRLEAQEATFRRHDVVSLEKEVGFLNTLAMRYQESEKLRRPFAHVLALLARSYVSGVHVTNLTMLQKSDGTFSVVLRGSSATREIFLQYAEKLRATKEFASIRSPLSNLLNERDVLFEVEVALQKELYFYAPTH